MELAIISNSDQSAEDANKRIKKVQNAIQENFDLIHPWAKVSQEQEEITEAQQLKSTFKDFGHDLDTAEGLSAWEEEMDKFLLEGEKSKDADYERLEKIKKLMSDRIEKRKKT